MEHTERIRALREDRDLNQTTVAKAIHVAQTTYSLFCYIFYWTHKTFMPGNSLH